ncbi:serine protease 1-like [Hoplias malabaricus]|uniref:serine protease 1-like n=1 Tax=Hoplias malabaricus TaxID=27720 RepID=UPI0034625623
MWNAGLLLLCLITVGAGSSGAEDVEKRLVSAVTCPDTESLHHVRVVNEFRDGTRATCGGTLINDRWVITASKCYNGRDSTLKVELGGHPRMAVKKQLRIAINDIRIYAKSKREEPIMMLKLPERVKNISPAKVQAGDCMAPSDGEELQVSGRGATTAEGGPGVKDLMCLEVKTLSKNHCPDLSGSRYKKYKYIYCGEGVDEAEIQACKGDSGSGLVKKEMTSKSHFFFWTKEVKVDVLYGVLISGHGDACEDKFIFVDICAKPIKKWIDKMLS